MAKQQSARSKRPQASIYSSDRPISRAAEDGLGRWPFAQQLAGDISSWKGKDSLVIGLYGPWGVGKTSLKNLVLESLKKRKAKISIHEFNPWQLSGTGGITAGLLEELGGALGCNGGDATEMKERAKKWKQYSQKLSIGGMLSKGLSLLFATSNEPEAAAFSTMAGEGLQQASDLAQGASDSLESSAGDEPTLAQLKAQIAQSLEKLDRPLLVVIDDIDRLSTQEILNVFQLVKINADFPKLVYLVLCEREIVCDALDSISGNRGAAFLEKIVQVSYHVPEPSKLKVRKELTSGLERIIGRDGVSKRWNRERWSEIYLGGVVGYFKNLRHVYRFSPSLDFHMRSFMNEGHF